ncbi:uncharacterized protein LOC144442088 [Glandiceps talaboti]
MNTTTLQDFNIDVIKRQLEKAANQKGTHKKLYRGRIMFVGAFGSGKTSTKRSLFNEAFEDLHLSTDGADIYGIDITEWIIKDYEYQGEQSLDETRQMMEDAVVSGIKKQQDDDESFIGMQPATTKTRKILEDLKSTAETDNDFCRRIDERLKTVEDVDKPDLFFSLWDTAGQILYYITHQVFLAHRVIYILVTDLTKALDDIISSNTEGPIRDDWTVKEFLSFWMNSIHAHGTPEPDPFRGSKSERQITASPPVIIVGAKKDLLIKECSTKEEEHEHQRDIEEEANKRLMAIGDYLRTNIIKASDHIVAKIAVDNKSREAGYANDPMIEELRKLIKKLAVEHFFLGEIPVKWIHLELTLRKMKKEMMKLEEVYKIGEEIDLDRSEVDKALKFYHSVGEILHFSEDPDLKNTVILDMGWLVGLFKLVITQPSIYRKNPQTPARVHNLVDELFIDGRLHEELVEYILKDHRRIEDKQVLLKILEMYDVICKKPKSSNEDPQSDIYYLPYLLQRHEEKDVICPKESSTCCPLYFHFPGNFLPDGLYYRLVVRCFKQWSQWMSLFKHRCRILVNNDEHLSITICKIGSDIEIRALNIPPEGEKQNKLQPQRVTDVRRRIEKELSQLIRNFSPGLSYRTCLKCTCPYHKPGQLVSGGRDVDDNCIAIEVTQSGTIKTDVVTCDKGGVPRKEPDLYVWYNSTSTQRKEDVDIESENCASRIDPLSELYQQLEGGLGEEDEYKLRNLLSGRQLPKRELERLGGPAQIFAALEERGLIGKKNLGFLRELLTKIHRRPLVELVTD